MQIRSLSAQRVKDLREVVQGCISHACSLLQKLSCPTADTKEVPFYKAVFAREGDENELLRAVQNARGHLEIAEELLCHIELK
jgi:hypothetical protein